MFTAIARLKSLQVFDVMCKEVVEVLSSDTMERAAVMFAARSITSAPVVNEQGDCVGVLSAADFLQRNAPQKHDDAAAAASDVVSKYMTDVVQSISPRASLLQAARIMCAKHVHRLPVIDEANRIVGVISTMDVVAALVNAIDEMDAAESGAH